MNCKELIRFIEANREQHNMPIQQLCKLAGVQRSHYYSLLKGGGFGFDLACRLLNVFELDFKVVVKSTRTPVEPMIVDSGENKKVINLTIHL